MGTTLSVALTTIAICSNAQPQNLELEEARIRRDALFREVSAFFEMMAEEDEKRRLGSSEDEGDAYFMDRGRRDPKNGGDDEVPKKKEEVMPFMFTTRFTVCFIHTVHGLTNHPFDGNFLVSMWHRTYFCISITL